MRTTEPPAPTPESIHRRTEHAKTEKALKALNKLTGLAFDATLELRTTMAAQLEELTETPNELKTRLTYEKRVSAVGVARSNRAAVRKEKKRQGRLRKLVQQATDRELHEMDFPERSMWERVEEQLFSLPVNRHSSGPTLDEAAALNHIVNPVKGQHSRNAQARAFMALPQMLQKDLFNALTLQPTLWPNQHPAA